jgi:signal transduction histidine kinase
MLFLRMNRGKIVLFKYLLIFFYLAGAWHRAIPQVNTDSLKEVIADIQGIEKLQAIQQLAFELQFTSLDEYYEYSRLGFEQALADHDSLFVASFLIDIGYYHKYVGEYQKSIIELKRGEIIAEKSKNRKVLGYAYSALGGVFHELGLYDKALDYHSKSLEIKKELGNSRRLGVPYNNIGLVYYKIGIAEKAEEYFNKALEIKLANGDTLSCIITYINLGLAFSDQDDQSKYQKAIDYFKKANILARKYNIFYRIGFSYNGLGQVFTDLGEYDSAKYYIRLSNEESYKHEYFGLESSNCYLLAKIAYEEQDFDLALNYLGRSTNLLIKLDDLNRQKNNFGLYAEIFEAKNNLDSAYFYTKRFMALKDSLFKDEINRNITNLEIASIEKQSQKEIADREDKISKSKLFNLFLLSILVLSIALIIVVFRNYVLTSKINRQLNDSKDKIEAQKENLQIKNEQLAEAQIIIQKQNEVLKNINSNLDKKVTERTEELNLSNMELGKAVRDLDQFIYKTSHDLRGPIATMQGIINLGVIEAKEATSKDYFTTLHKVSTNLNNVLTRLIEVHETYQKKPELEFVDPEGLIMASRDKVSQYVVDPEIKIVTDLQAKGKWKSDKHLFDLIILNMLKNAILYRDGSDAMVKIKTELRDKDMFMSFEDNGFGIQPGDVEKVFNIFFKGSYRPGGTGLEIYTAKIAVEKLGGKIVLRKPVKNTIFEISLPVL